MKIYTLTVVDHSFRKDSPKMKATPIKSPETTSKLDNSFKAWKNSHKNGQHLTAIISFQLSKQKKSGDTISLTVNAIKHFLSRIGEKYTLHKKSNTSNDTPKSWEAAVKEVMKTITSTYYIHTYKAEPLYEAADEEDQLSLFDK